MIYSYPPKFMMQEIEIVPLVSYISSVNSRYTYCSYDVIILSYLWFNVGKRNFLSMHNLQQRENSCKCNQSVALLMYHILQTFIMTIALLANASLLIYDGWE